jgi:ATP-binding cassette, subfamily B, multidrug efflux pump
LKELAYLNRYFLRYRYHLLGGLFFVAASNVFAVLSPQVVRHAVNLVSENRLWYEQLEGTAAQALMRERFLIVLLLFGGVYLALALVRGAFMFLMRQTLIIMSRLIEYDLKNALYAHYQRMDQGFYRRNNTGDLMSRVAEDVGRVRMYAGPALMYAMNLVVLFVLVIYTMLRINPQLTLYVLLPLPILSVSIYYVNNIINRRSEAIQAQLSELTSRAQEVFSGIRVVKAYAQEDPMARHFEKECVEYRQRSLSLARVDSIFQPLMMVLIGLSTIITIYIGGVQVIAGVITPGNVAEFVIYVNMLTWPVASLGWVASIIQRAAASQKRINEFLATEPALPDQGSTLPDFGADIEFDRVSFTYPDTGIQALRDVSFRLPAGRRFAVFGRTGSGKSTLAELLVRMYDPDSGSIRIGGVDLRDIPLGELRRHIGYVPQDAFLFSESVAYNIQFGDSREDHRAERALELARYASIDEEIAAFPKAYDTRIGERGVTLSGGQKQRISIARAFARNAPVLILDDCLSAVDAGTEKRILDNLGAYLQNRTALIITHRVFSLPGLDRVLVLDDGSLAEQGTHEELLEARGLYAALYEQHKLEESKV